MKRKISLSAALVLMLIAILLTFLIVNSAITAQFAEKLESLNTEQQEFQKLATVDSIVREHFARPIDKTALSEGSIEGFVAGLGDSASRYLTAEEYAEYLLSKTQEQQYSLGFSVAFNEKTGLARISHVESSSAALQFGMKTGDTLLSIGGVSVEEKGIDAVLAMLNGEKDTGTGVSVMRDGELITYTLSYAAHTCDLVTGSLEYGQAALITVRVFENETASELKTCIDSMIASGADALVFDVRGIESADFDSAVKCADVIAGVGDLARLYTGAENMEVLSADGASIPLDCAVLVDENTAGAPELFAAALRDAVGAKLVGNKTAGKNGVQADIKLNDGSAIVLTTKLYLPPVSDTFEAVGLTPDLEQTSDVACHSVSPSEDAAVSEAYYLLKPEKRPGEGGGIIELPEDGGATDDPILIEPDQE